MSATSQAIAPRWTPTVELGRPFVSRPFDLLVIGGGLSLVVAAWVKLDPISPASLLADGRLWVFILLCNSAHFAASTVRLYAKEGAFKDLRFLTMALPLLSVLVVTLAVAHPEVLGRHLQALYFTWSPYHYAAQAYGLSVMYCYRSGTALEASHKRWFRLACLMPFLYAFVDARGAGLEWFVPESVWGRAAAYHSRTFVLTAFSLLSFALPAALFLRLQFASARPMPLISLLLMVSNGVWWIALTYMDAFVWATVFHSLQYLAIATVFQVKDDLRRGGAGARWWPYALRFYALCLLLGYFLFQVWPHAYVLMGFGYAQSLLLVVAVINIHHFVVDAYIWRLRKDPNYAVVTGARA